MNINKLFKNKYFLPTLQVLTLLVFISLIIGSIGVTTQDPKFAKVLKYTNLSNLIVWSYWWPIIIVTAILFGRFWCSVCPMELVSFFVGKIGLKRKPDKILKSGWVVTVFYAIILVVGIHTFAIHRVPQYMAFYMLILFSFVIISSLIWEKRTFCTHICPIGHLLGLYSLLSAKKLRVKDPEVCKTCKTKDCISKSNYNNFSGRSCTSNLYPVKISDNRKCILCGQCFKSCTHDNIAIQKRKFAADLFEKIKLSWAEISFFMIVSGFVIYEICSEWSVSKDVLTAFPNLINQTLNITGRLSGTVNALVLFIIIPIIFYSILSLIKTKLGKESLKDSFTQIVISILPITASMHLLKALLRTTSSVPYWGFVLKDPKGIETAQKIIENPEILNKSFTSAIDPLLSIISILLIFSGLGLSILVIKKQKHQTKTSRWTSIIATIIYSMIFIISLFAWRFF